jgi:hypothetical protein
MTFDKDILTNPIPVPQETEDAGLRDPARLQQALDEVLSGAPFRNTQQCQNLLRYIVKHTLAGEDRLLRERVIGSEVFGRPPDYETGEDPVIRLRVAEVRKRLAQFYQSAQETPHIQIEIPPGSYRATFRWRDGSRAAVHEPQALLTAPPVELEPYAFPPAPEFVPAAPVVAGEVSASAPKRRIWWIGAGVFVLLLIAAVFSVYAWNAAQTAQFQAFWSPWTVSPKPVIIAIGSNAVYRLSANMTDEYAREHHLETHGAEFFVPLARDASIKGSDLEPAWNSFVALGDVAAVSNVVASLTRRKQSFQERFPDDISFAELRNCPSILVGGFNNPKTLELTKDLRFVLRARNEIDDAQDPNRRWQLNASNDSHDTEDYAIITRLTQRQGDAPVLAVAGMGQHGTLAAADFVCNPAALSEMARRLPKGWANRNLQLVLHVKIVDFKPAMTEVVAVHSW